MNEIALHSRVLAALDALDAKERLQVSAVIDGLKNGGSASAQSGRLLRESQNEQVFLYPAGPSLRLIVRRTCNEPKHYEVTDIVRREALETYAA